MRKYFYILTGIISVCLLAACNIESNNFTDQNPMSVTVTNTPMPTLVPTSTPVPTAKPTVTNTPTPAPTSTPTPASMGTPMPVPTNILTPTSTPEPTNTPTPEPTSIPTPMPTNTPTPTATNTPIPSPTKVPSAEGLTELSYKENTIIDAKLCRSKEEAASFFVSCIMEGWRGFGILVEDSSMLHTLEQYKEMCPGIIDITVSRLVKFHNGIWLEFESVKCKENIEYFYAIRTGDTDYLDSTQLQVYRTLLSVMKELALEEKSDIEKIVAVHDYIVLNTEYDIAAADAFYTGNSEYDTDVHFVEGVLLNQKAVCSGYAYTFNLFMDAYGIPCEYVSNEIHGWNIVKVGEEWYHIDVTWDDPVPDREGKVMYTHFMMTDEEIMLLDSHETWSCECEVYHHKCDDNSYRIYPYKEYFCESEEEAVLLMQLQEESRNIFLVYPTESALNEDILLNKALERYGKINYYPAQNLGGQYLMLEIVLE